VEQTLQQIENVIVVNDGCTDQTAEVLRQFPGVTVVSFAQNRGKGAALLAGFREARSKGFDYAITLDADGQHFPSEIAHFIGKNAEFPDALLVGCRTLTAENMPRQNTFANRFSNFWFRLYTWVRLDDTQSGYRLYPLRRLSGLRFVTNRYEAELALLVFAAWASVPIVGLPVRVYYPPEGERVTHFRPFWDFFRISVLNTLLFPAALLYGWPRMLLHRLRGLFR